MGAGRETCRAASRAPSAAAGVPRRGELRASHPHLWRTKSSEGCTLRR